jgi:Allene oxide cyclase barrel like domain
MQLYTRLHRHIRAVVAIACGAGIVFATSITAASRAQAGTPQSTAAAASTAGAEVQARGDCIYIGNGVTERTVNFYYVGSTPNPTPIQQVGDGLIYYDEIYDAAGQVIGHAIGYVSAVMQQSPGHLETEYHETVELPQGRLTTTGFIERQALFSGATLHLQAVGISGQFAGKYGYRDWALKQPIPVPLTDAEPVVVNIKMCG